MLCRDEPSIDCQSVHLLKCFKSPRSKMIMHMLFKMQNFLNTIIEMKKFCRMYGSAVITVVSLFIFETPILYHLDLNLEICSGNGNCACNKCQCDTDTDGGKKFYVRQCFLSDSVP